jgi:hypothetical protein
MIILHEGNGVEGKQNMAREEPGRKNKFESMEIIKRHKKITKCRVAGKKKITWTGEQERNAK